MTANVLAIEPDNLFVTLSSILSRMRWLLEANVLSTAPAEKHFPVDYGWLGWKESIGAHAPTTHIHCSTIWHLRGTIIGLITLSKICLIFPFRSQ